jgi:uncharacterized membrane protein YagU involved in acid resistance
MRINFGKAVLAGIIGTLLMTAVGLWVAPMMGIPRMNPADMLAGQMGGNIALGWAGHLMIGTILAVVYAAVSPRLPGPYPLRGALYALAPFLMAQVLVMPMMGMPLFSGSVPMAMGSLIGHLIYGAVLGSVYGAGTESATARRPIVA